MPIWLKRAPASILIFFSLVPEVLGTVSDWERTAVPQAKSRNWSVDGGWQADCIYCEQQHQSHRTVRANSGSASNWTATLHEQVIRNVSEPDEVPVDAKSVTRSCAFVGCQMKGT